VIRSAITPVESFVARWSHTPTVKKLIEENRLDKLAAAIETGTEDGTIR
jgi:Tfp pilus assembly pilus retraction ATPase PilT